MSKKQRNYKPHKTYLCELHKAKGRYPREMCYACFRATLDAPQVMALKKLFPTIMKDD